jgi:serine/threonine-protein phosphatase 2A regulatory subunit B
MQAAAGTPAQQQQQQAADGQLDCNSKLLHLAWHPEANVIACAAANSLYMYCA